MIDVNLNLYRTFLVFAKAKSLADAVEKLNISQPAISLQIKNLENILGVKLFYREKGIRMKLTKDGESLLKYVEESYNILMAGQKLVLDDKKMENGTITIGVQSHIGTFYLMDLIRLFNSKYSNINIRLITETSRNLINLLSEHKIDFVLDSSSLLDNVSKSITVEKIDSFDTCLIISKELYDSNKDIKDFKFVLPLESSRKRRELEQIFSNNNIDLNIILEVETTDLIISAVKSSIGVGYVVKKAVKEELEQGSLFELEIPYVLPKMDLRLAYCEDYLTTSSKYFIKNYIK